MAKLRPEDKASPRVAWARRLMLLGVVLFVACFMLNYSFRFHTGNILEGLLAEQVMATGEIKVSAQDDHRVRTAFERAQGAQTAESALIFVSADSYGRKYEVRATAPKRDQALAQLEALLAKFREEYGGDLGRDLWTFSSASVPVVQTPGMIAKRRQVNLGLLLAGLVTLVAGLWLYWSSPSSERTPLTTWQ